MHTAVNSFSQEKKTEPEATRWNLDWRPCEVDDALFFAEFTSERFLLRPWRMSDDRHASGVPPLGTHYSDLKDLELVTICFRAGCRIVCFYSPNDHTAWQHAQNDARFILNEFKELGIDGGRPNTGRGR